MSVGPRKAPPRPQRRTPRETPPVRRIDTDPRFRRRRQTVQRTKRRRLLVRSLVVAGVVLGLWGAFFSPLLEVRRVTVAGAERTPVSEVVRAADLGPGDNLLRISGGEVVERVATLPWVRDVKVDRMLPGTVRVRVIEREPRIVLALGAARWTLDGRGHVLTAGEVSDGLPVLAGVQIGSVEPGARLRTTESTAALQVFRSLPPKLKGRVVGIFAPTIERITLSLDDGLTVRYGAAEYMSSKNGVLSSLLRRLRREGSEAGYVDVRVPGNPAVFERAPEAEIPPPEETGDHIPE